MVETLVVAVKVCLEELKAIKEQRLSRHLPKLVRDQPDIEFIFVVALIAQLSGAWGMLDKPAQNKVTEFIPKVKGSDIIKVLVISMNVEALRQEIQIRITH